MLGVDRSLLGKRWRARLADSMAGLSLAQAIEVPELVGRVLAARGIAAEEAQDYLDPTLRRLLPDPLHLRDMETAIARLARALEAGEKIAIFGDYDVDGATSAALLSRFLAAVAAPPTIYIPDRLREGYGPNANAMRMLAAQDVRVVVTVDCGISAFDALADAADAGLDVIVVDHHVAEARLPPACAVIDPNRLDDDSPHGQLAAVGVAFLLVVGLNRHLREAGWYRDRAEPDLCSGSTWWRSAPSATWCRSPASTAPSCARARSDAAAPQPRAQGARRCRRAGGAAGRLSPGLHPGPPRQRRRPRGRSEPGGAPHDHGGRGRGAEASRATSTRSTASARPSSRRCWRRPSSRSSRPAPRILWRRRWCSPTTSAGTRASSASSRAGSRSATTGRRSSSPGRTASARRRAARCRASISARPSPQPGRRACWSTAAAIPWRRASPWSSLAWRP